MTWKDIQRAIGAMPPPPPPVPRTEGATSDGAEPSADGEPDESFLRKAMFGLLHTQMFASEYLLAPLTLAGPWP
jgi:hypothetical protein